MRNLIIFLIRKKLHVKPYEYFTFADNKSATMYYFTKDKLMTYTNGVSIVSHVKLNTILDDEIEIVATGAKHYE